jgi:hypothetical protein
MRAIALSLLVLASSAAAGAQAELPAGAVVAAVAPVSAPTPIAEQEQFLLTAKVRKVTGVKKGVTGTQRATLSDGSRDHDASIQSIDETRQRFESARRTEFNFRDYWGYNVAAYRLGAMLGIDMIPPSVERRFRYQDAAYTWWIDDVIMDEQARAKTGVAPPDPVYWSAQLHVLRVFDELIANTDRNQGNMLIDRRWKLWLIDHTRGFRTTPTLAAPLAIRRCERTMFTRMKGLTYDSLRAELGRYLTEAEMRALLARRDLIVERIEALGPRALYDLQHPLVTQGATGGGAVAGGGHTAP